MQAEVTATSYAMNPFSPETRPKLLPVISTCLVVLISATLYYRSTYHASNLAIVPDSVEYALAAHRWVTNGTYDILVGGQSYPPRYPPWFSIGLLAPFIQFFGGEPGAAIIPIYLFALAGALLTYRIAYRSAGLTGAGIATLCLFLVHAYAFYSRQVMTDVPCAVAILGASLLYLNLRAGVDHSLRTFLAAGALAAVAAAMRPAALTIVIPFFVQALGDQNRRSTVLRVAGLSLPVLTIFAAGTVYNSAVFGSAFRTGYHFWCPVPYEIAGMTLSTAYLPTNLNFFIRQAIMLPVVAAVLLYLASLQYWRSERNASPALLAAGHLMTFLILGTGPLALIHLLYFFPDPRFFLPMAMIAVSLIGVLAGGFFRRLKAEYVVAAQVIVLAMAIIWRIYLPEPNPDRRIAADQIRRLTSDGDVVITGIDPAYLETILSDLPSRRIIPISRRVEYASKLIAPRPMADLAPPPGGWQDSRNKELARRGAVDPIVTTAADHLEALAKLAPTKKRLFLETSAIVGGDALLLEYILHHCVLTPVAKDLFVLSCPEDKSTVHSDAAR